MADPTNSTSTPAVDATSAQANAGAAPAGTGAGDGTGGAPPAATQSKTYSEDAWRKRESALDKQMNEIRKAATVEKDALQTQIDALNEQLLDMQEKAMLGTLEAQGGDVNLAKQVYDLQKKLAKREKEIARQEADFASTKEAAARAVKVMKARDFAEQFNLSNEDAAGLLEASDVQDMELRALRLALERTNASQTTTAQPNNTPTTTTGVDLDKMPEEKRLAFLLGKEFAKIQK